MKPKTLALLVVAIGCGLVASYMTSRLIADRGTQQETPKIAVVYATKNVPQGMLVKNPEDYFQQRMMPEELAPRGKVIRELAELKDKRLINPIGADKHVSADDLLNKDDPGLQNRIPIGMRAVSVKVSQDIAVTGFIQPGMHVDIACVPQGKLEAKTILQKVLILAVNQTDFHDKSEKRAIETQYVTFALSPDDSEKITLASHTGHLRLLLRHSEDEKAVVTRGATAGDLSKTSQDPGEQGAAGDSGTTTGQPVPSVPLTTPAGEAVTSKPEGPPQPVLQHVMRIRNGQNVVVQKFYDEPVVEIEKSDPEAGPDAPAKTGTKPKTSGGADAPADGRK